MTLDITGSYTITIPITTMFLNTTFKIRRFNIITFFGESFFLNRMINDEFKPIQYILLGNASNNPSKEDLKLGNETSRRKCLCKVDFENKTVVLVAGFKANEVVGTCEIGVANDSVLISHDKYTMVDDSFLGLAGEVNIEYIFQFTTGALKTGWKSSTMDHVFYCYESNTVVGVFENNTNSGYVLAKDLNELSVLRGSYYHDTGSNNLYIHPKNDNVVVDDLNSSELIVQVR